MTKKAILGWFLLLIVGLFSTTAAYRNLAVFYPDSWSMSRAEARAAAEEYIRDLGDPLENGFVVTELRAPGLLEVELAESPNPEKAAASTLAQEVLGWRVSFYESGASSGKWTYRVSLAASGEVLALTLNVGEDINNGIIEDQEALAQASAFLKRIGIPEGRYLPPRLLATDMTDRRDLSLIYEDPDRVLPGGVPHGIEVSFVGDRLTGVQSWRQEEISQDILARFSTLGLLSTLWITMPFVVFPLVVIFFLRRYHAGEVGVARSLRILLLVWLAGVITITLSSKGATEGMGFGAQARALVPWSWGFQILVLWFPALGLISGLSWAVGERFSREVWGSKLVAFDFLLKGRWNHGVIARSTLRGLALGSALTALTLLSAFVFRLYGVEWGGIGFGIGPWYQHSPWPGITLFFFSLAIGFYGELFGRFFLLSVLRPRWGLAASVAASALFGILNWPPLALTPLWGQCLLAAAMGALLAIIFLKWDLLTVMTASIGGSVLLGALPFLFASDPSIQFQGALALALVALPAAISLPWISRTDQVLYRWDDIPPHVRRIAERERQRVELETARNIQNSILPDLPPSLVGVELASSYRPASEVGGDFYDVVALENGQLAVAMGDVAGHGVSSGLIMSMAKSALAVQVTMDPSVEAVFRTLNRTVYQTARRRLLATLSYGLLDPIAREFTFGSAGHLAPYRLTQNGVVEEFSASSYPLGVREEHDLRVRKVQLKSGEKLFFYTDGIVEARGDKNVDDYGFQRLEESLRRHWEEAPEKLCEKVLEDVEVFTGGTPREDDQTVLVLTVP